MTETKQMALDPVTAEKVKPNARLFDIDEAAAIAKLLHNVYFGYPSEDFINLLADNDISKTWHMFIDSEEYQAGLGDISVYLENWNNNKLTDLMLDYGDLYFGASMPLALPWGSCWLTEQRLLNDVSTHELLKFYHAHAIELNLDKNQPADHIGIFLSVIAQLLEQISADPADKQSQQVLSLLLSKHLLTWSDKFIQASTEHAKTSFYRGMAFLLKDLLNALSEEFGILPMAQQSHH
ncbi:molecular chaperone TorD family protein [Shewanella abyssi]|uniref:TorD/DmsD family molecular chaperone n=1 Tax=Shewanella abyssi TaxID=311789 RepID=UPI00200DD204|nr:molecular chaperone TorD family protein [Shewanella abyssi]MCL1048712.1 molecular chaperone TorD family protein [Shewanella abyssi]